MKFIITENRLNKLALSWMNKHFSPDQLKIVKFKEYPNSIFYKKDGEIVMEQDKENKYFWFDYDQIWSFFESFFDMGYQQIRDVLRHWLEETFKLEGYRPYRGSFKADYELDEI
jgi:hypothetical protein